MVSRKRLHWRVALLLLFGTAGCQDQFDEPVGPAREPLAFTSVALAPFIPAANSISAAHPNRYIVILKDGVPNAEQVARDLGRQYSDTVRHVYRSLPGFAGDLSSQAVDALRRNPHVAYIEQDRPAYLNETDTNAGWALGRIDQRDGPSNYEFTYASTGAGVNIYIVDSGIKVTHSDFGGRARGAWTFDPSYPADDDCNGHGTAVASVAGGTEYGVAKGAALWSVRGNDCNDWQWVSDWTAAIDWVTANHVKPAVMNFSIGVANWIDDISPGSM